MKKQLAVAMGVVFGLAIGGAAAWYYVSHQAEPAKPATAAPVAIAPAKPPTPQPVSQPAPSVATETPPVATPATQTDDSTCFKEAFKKTVGAVTWRVLSCEHAGVFGQKGGNMQYKVEYREGKGETDVTIVEYVGDTSWITGDDYRVISPKTLYIGMPAERGGTAYLVHRGDEGGFAQDKIHYMTNDEDGLTATESNNTIHLKSAYNDIVYNIDTKGKLHKIKDHGGTMTCEKEGELVDHNADDYKLVVEKQFDNIISVTYFGSNSNGEEGGASFCDFKASNDDDNATFEQKGDRTTVSMKNEQSRIVITEHKSDDTFTATLNVAQDNCGPHSTFPKKMVLHADHTCEVTP